MILPQTQLEWQLVVRTFGVQEVARAFGVTARSVNRWANGKPRGRERPQPPPPEVDPTREERIRRYEARAAAGQGLFA